MKSLKDYIVEAEQWMEEPDAGDNIDIELEDGTLLETYIMAREDNAILLDATREIYQALTEWAELTEDTNDDYKMEDQSGMIQFDKSLADAPVKPVANMEEGQMKELMWRDAEQMTLEQFVDKYGDEDWVREFYNNIMGDLDEAKYQGREVALNKPTAGDVKKFKVYVKDPATGNIKKVNFGHGGKTAKRLGQKTMRIRKSNPAARKNFRARHNCANPGPKTKARYWSCRKW
jgi:hypothetical protein